MRYLTLFISLTICISFISCKPGSAKLENRSPGELSFRSNCQTCHILPKPSSKTDEQWPDIVMKYGDKAKLSIQVQNQIIAYLISQN